MFKYCRPLAAKEKGDNRAPVDALSAPPELPPQVCWRFCAPPAKGKRRVERENEYDTTKREREEE